MHEWTLSFPDVEHNVGLFPPQERHPSSIPGTEPHLAEMDLEKAMQPIVIIHTNQEGTCTI